MMKLKRFRVTNFRSVINSGWIDVDDVGALIGVNESGKSNLLLPLWKLNAAKGGEINPQADYPRSQFNQIRDMENSEKPVFIEAEFELPTDAALKVSQLTGYPADQVQLVRVNRSYSGARGFSFPNAKVTRSIAIADATDILNAASVEIGKITPLTKAEEPIKAAILEGIHKAERFLADSGQTADKALLSSAKQILEAVSLEGASARSTISPRFGQVIDQVSGLIAQVSKPAPQRTPEAVAVVSENLPKFVYYSHYGNLDSEIYLPHVLENMKRTDLGTKDEAKARTLKVLFDFVGVDPEEIANLGKESGTFAPSQTKEIAALSQKKRERGILLESAQTRLTKEFKEWWKQGNYRFRFAADGNHFRILVSDEKRPEEIELEGRSTGLQWFLSFFLVFLVEAQGEHEGAILLLDEPGLTLHPLAQRDLTLFFDNLAETNQIIFSTHSPFMVEPDRLDRVRAVYSDDKGQTVVTADLRSAAPQTIQAKSIYAAHAALGLTVSDALLQGCQAVVVEGPSDQVYLTTIKTYLISQGLFKPTRELIFVPGGGTNAIRAVSSILTGKSEELPHVLLDSDSAGMQLAANLKSGLYSHEPDKIALIGDLLGMPGGEVEDLLPHVLIADAFSRLYRGREEDFRDTVVKGRPLIPQMKHFAEANGHELKLGWKVELAKEVKRRIVQSPALLTHDADLVEVWAKVFERFSAAQTSASQGLVRSQPARALDASSGAAQ